MSTLVCFHAHPDDESIATGGAIARAVDEGHRVVVVIATDGRHGEVPEGVDGQEGLVRVRRRETEASVAALGAQALYWLGYHDSGMTGWAQNDEPNAFIKASLDEAAEKLAAILEAEQCNVFTCYDWHGGYGHPDHIQVHRVGHRAAELRQAAGQKIRVFESTMNRTRMIEMMKASGAVPEDFDPEAPADDGNPFGSSADEITMTVDVSAFVERKRESIKCHASQVTDSSMFLSMPPEIFAIAFGQESFIEKGKPGGAPLGWFW